MNTLIILTSHDQLGDSGAKTGFWLEEFASPYYVLVDAGVDVTLASPKGGQPPLDPKSDAPDFQTEATERFKNDPAARDALAQTAVLSDLNVDGFDSVLYPGGHGPLWDLVSDPDSIAVIERMFAAGKPVAAVCHAPAVLLAAKAPNGDPLVQGRNVTGFTNTEEAAVQLTDIVPFLLEDELKRLGGNFSCADDWQPHAITDGNLITGQNPASSRAVAEELLKLLQCTGNQSRTSRPA